MDGLVLKWQQQQHHTTCGSNVSPLTAGGRGGSCVRLCVSQVILSRQYGSEGRFTFTSHTPGEHQICLHSNSSKFALFAGGMLVGAWERSRGEGV